MGKRTLKTCWKQYERLSRGYLDDEDNRESFRERLDTLTIKANNDRIGNALYALFVRPYLAQPLTVEFTTALDDGVPEWQTAYVEEDSALLVHPVSIFKFRRDIREIKVNPEKKEDLLRSRYLSFLSEIEKLPSIYLLFLLVLQRVAYLLEIAHLEKRGGVVEIAEGEPYHTLLWAFKELETFCRKAYGVNIRADFGISWYEADWITGR
jgi:hypothetical protein